MSDNQSLLLFTIMDGNGERFTLSVPPEAQFLVGRGKQTAIQGERIYVADSAASRKHLRLYSRGALWFVEDAGSSNGTFLGVQKLGGPRPYEEGAVIAFGNSSITMHEDSVGSSVGMPTVSMPAIDVGSESGEETFIQTSAAPGPGSSTHPGEGENGRTVIHSTISYELLDKIGEGGMGEVFKARLNTNVGTSEMVAVKKIRQQLLASQDSQEVTRFFQQTFERETSIISELNGHPNIVGFKGADYIGDPGTPGKEFFFVMEYVNGIDLSHLMKLHGMQEAELFDGKALLIPKEFVGFILFRVANALDYAHNFTFSNGTRGIVHLDISPGNILINTSLGMVKLTDFGVASSIEEMGDKEGKGFQGKLSYSSPEMLVGRGVGFASDIYSLGVLMYELLTGLNPNKVPDMKEHPSAEWLMRQAKFLMRPLVPPHELVRGIDRTLSEIVMSMLEYEKENRINSARKLRETVGRAIYSSGYGPTDNSFADYLRKIQMINALDKRKARGPTRAKSGDFDEMVEKLIESFRMELDQLRFQPGVGARYESGENPCRI